ncbi:MAG: hypothetical protein ACRDH5_13285 [bacterium]
MSDDEETSNGKYQIKARLAVVEPESLVGNSHFEAFVIGSNDDPSADDPNTWKGLSAGRYREMLTKSGVELTGDVEQDIATAVGQTIGAHITQTIEPAVTKDGQPNPYAGRVRSQVAPGAFFRPGEKEVGLDAAPTDNGVAPRVAPRAIAPAAKPAAPVAKPPAAPVVKAPAAAPRAAPVAKAAPATKVQMLPCPICSESVERAGFTAHVESHE